VGTGVKEEGERSRQPLADSQKGEEGRDGFNHGGHGVHREEAETDLTTEDTECTEKSGGEEEGRTQRARIIAPLQYRRLATGRRPLLSFPACTHWRWHGI